MHSGSETEDGHDNKFMNLKIDAGDTGKIKPSSRSKTSTAHSDHKKSVMFSVGQEEVAYIFYNKRTKSKYSIIKIGGIIALIEAYLITFWLNYFKHISLIFFQESEIDDKHGHDKKKLKEEIGEDGQPKRRRKRY